MRYLFIFHFFIFSFFAKAQIITTFVGNGVMGYSGDGNPATAASIGSPNGCIFDSYGNFYFADASANVIRKITPSGIIRTVAGTGASGYNGDGILATDARLNIPVSVVVDTQNNLFIADGENSRIRRVDALTGIITTIAGDGALGFGGDGGPATAAVFKGVQNICFDKYGNLYVLDYSNFRVRKINASGIISTVAGTGVSGDGGDGGMATDATIENMVGICTDQIGNLFFSEQGLKVRKVSVATGIISTFAGIDPEGSVATGDGGPATAASLDPYDLAFDKTGNLYVAGYLYNNVRKIDNLGFIYTVTGIGTAGYNGDNIPATAAKLNSPIGIALDSCDNLYVTEIRNYRIRKIAINPLCAPEKILNSIATRQTINVYPNPTFDELNIVNLSNLAAYRVLNMVETIMLIGNLKEGNNSINIQSIPNGVYILEITDEEKNRTVSKIIKQ